MVARKIRKPAGEQRASTHSDYARGEAIAARAAIQAQRRAGQTPGPRVAVRPTTANRIDGTKGRLDNGPSDVNAMRLPSRSVRDPLGAAMAKRRSGGGTGTGGGGRGTPGNRRPR